MAEKSLFWFTDGFDGAIGDGAAPYTEEEFRGYNAALLGEGVVADAGNELAVTGTATPLAVNTGRAQVAGFHYFNTASVDLAVTTPSVGTTGGRVALVADWTTATVRLAIKLNTDGNVAIPGMTQTPGVLYEISLASFTVTTGGVITLTDTRQFIREVSFLLQSNGAIFDASDYITASGIFGIPMAVTFTTKAHGILVCPVGLVGSVVATPIIGQETAGGGNVYLKNSANYAAIPGDLLNDNVPVTAGPQAIAVPGDNNIATALPVTIPASPGDLISFTFERIAGNAGDTYAGTLGFLGWKISYKVKP
jgi:hypothetical protein